MTADPFMTELTAAMAIVRAGDRSGGRTRLEALWASIAANPDPYHECAFAHLMADVQDDPKGELAWDLRALGAAQRFTAADGQRHTPPVSVATFWPSLYVNLAEDYFKLGDLEQSRAHLTLARSVIDTLPDDAYGQLIRCGIERMAKKLEAP